MNPTKFLCLTVLCISLALADQGIDQEIPLSEGDKVHAREEELRESTQMNYQNFKYQPFVVATSFQLVLEQDEKGDISIDIGIRWIDRNKRVTVFPSYNQKEYMTVLVYDEQTRQTVAQKTFFFCTRFTFPAEAGRKYRAIFTNSGSSKMLEFGVSYIDNTFDELSASAANMTTLQNSAVRIGKIFKQFETRIKVSDEAAFIDEDLHERIERNINSYYKWAVWEICLVGVIIFTQIWVVGRETKGQFHSF